MLNSSVTTETSMLDWRRDFTMSKKGKQSAHVAPHYPGAQQRALCPNDAGRWDAAIPTRSEKRKKAEL
jgi:hypothetical protein